MHHAAIRTQATVLGKHVVDRGFLHLLHDGGGVIRARGLNGLEVVQGGRVHRSVVGVGLLLHHRFVALGPLAGFVVQVPIPTFGEVEALGGVEA